MKLLKVLKPYIETADCLSERAKREFLDRVSVYMLLADGTNALPNGYKKLRESPIRLYRYLEDAFQGDTMRLRFGAPTGNVPLDKFMTKVDAMLRGNTDIAWLTRPGTMN